MELSLIDIAALPFSQGIAMLPLLNSIVGSHPSAAEWPRRLLAQIFERGKRDAIDHDCCLRTGVYCFGTC